MDPILIALRKLFKQNSKFKVAARPMRYTQFLRSCGTHLVLGRCLGRFPVCVANRTRLANLSWGILIT